VTPVHVKVSHMYEGYPESKDTKPIKFFKNIYQQNRVKKLFNTYL
jgi:hypothetical protein